MTAIVMMKDYGIDKRGEFYVSAFKYRSRKIVVRTDCALVHFRPQVRTSDVERALAEAGFPSDAEFVPVTNFRTGKRP